MTQVTRKEACELIRQSMGKKVPSGEQFNQIVVAANNDFPVRDFMLGLPQYYEMQQVIDFLCQMANDTAVEDDAPFVGVLSALAYEVGDMEQFFKHIGYMSVNHSDYSLTKLLMRIAQSGFPPSQLTEMRKELHAKVMDICYKQGPDVVITEEEEEGTYGKHISSVSGVSDSSENAGQEEAR